MEEKELLYFIKNKLARYALIWALAAIMVMMYLGVSQAAGDVALAKPSADILIKAMKNAKKVNLPCFIIFCSKGTIYQYNI